ncbi:hypothetical protein LZ31DRAFT_436957, partial [Colletotrichum somersetense]
FVFSTEFSVAICKKCRYAVVGNEVLTHLRNQHRGIEAAERKRIADRIRSLRGIICSQTELQSFRYPDPTVEPIAHIAPPQADGLRCHACRSVCRCVVNMQRHCRAEHGWKNDWSKGG